jgi:hypothetical protein
LGVCGAKTTTGVIITFFTINSFSVIHNVIEGEAVVMNLDTGLYFSFNPPASQIWEKVSEGNFDETAIRAFAGPQNQHFLDFLVDQKLVSREIASGASEHNQSPLSPLDGTAEWDTFSDMKELLLLDPVHDIALGDQSWPESRDNPKEA